MYKLGVFERDDSFRGLMRASLQDTDHSVEFEASSYRQAMLAIERMALGEVAVDALLVGELRPRNAQQDIVDVFRAIRQVETLDRIPIIGLLDETTNVANIDVIALDRQPKGRFWDALPMLLDTLATMNTLR